MKIFKQSMVVLVSLAVLVGIIAWMSGVFHAKIEPGSVEPTVRKRGTQPTDRVHKVVQNQAIRIAGTLRAQNRTDVSARIMAAIVEMRVTAGDRVKQDDVVAVLDDRDLKSQVEEARQAVAAAEAAQKNAARDFERFKSLVAQKVASGKEFDDAAARNDAAMASLLQAREAFSSAQTILSYSVIRAPMSGIVVDKLMDKGDTTQPSRPLLTIYDPSVLRLEAAIPEALAAGLKTGDRIGVTLESVQDAGSKPLEGVLEEIVPQADALSRSVLVKVALPAGFPGAIEGAFGRLLIPSQDRIRLCLAQSAVQREGQLDFVEVVRPDGTLERRQIQLGERSPYGRVEVLSGLEADEEVVLHGPPPAPLPAGVRLFQSGGSK